MSGHHTPTWNDARKTFLLTQVAGSTGYWTLNDLEYAYANGANPPTTFAALDTVNTVWLYGASIEAGISAGAATDATSAALTNYLSYVVGRTITVVNKGVSGQNLAQIKTRFDGEAAAATALGNQLLIVTMPMGNDISANLPYPGGDASIQSGMQALLEAMIATGAYVMPVNTTFRDYGGVGVTVNNEEGGSLPYNENILLPLAQSLTPTMIYDDGDLWADPYNFARNWYSVVLSDAVHYTGTGYTILGRYWMDAVASRVLGTPETPPRIARVADPTLDQTTVPQSVGFYITTGSGFGVDASILGIYYRGVYNAGIDQSLPPLSGYTPTSVKITNYGHGAGASLNSTNLDTGNTSPTLLNDAALRTTIPVDTTTWFRVCEWSGLAPNQPVTVQFTAARYVLGGAANRVGDYSIDGGATFVSHNGAVESGAEVVVHEITGYANGSGVVTFDMRRQDASSFAYFNGAILIPE